MTTEAEKLKKRLEVMNQELALRRRKLKRHIRKKEIKSVRDKSSGKTSFRNCETALSNVEESFVLETSVAEEKHNAEGVHNYSGGLQDNLNTNATNSNIEPVDSIYDSCHEHDLSAVPILEKGPEGLPIPAILQNSQTGCAETDADVVSPAVTNNLTLPLEFSVLEEKKQTNFDDTLGFLSSSKDQFHKTPTKSFVNKKNDLSPILTQKHSAVKTVTRPQTRGMQRKIKGFYPPNQSKKKEYISFSPLGVNPNRPLKCKDGINPNVSNDKSLGDDATVAVSSNDTLPFRKDSKYVEPENTFSPFPSCTVKIKSKEGPVINGFCDGRHLVLVQQYQVNFWNMYETRDSTWSHVGFLSRKQVHNGVWLGSKFSNINFYEEKIIVCIELWCHASNHKDQTTLTSVVYSYNITHRNLKCYCLDLKHVIGQIENIRFCILQELSIVVSWTNKTVSTITKFSLDNDAQVILKTTHLTPVKDAVNSLHVIKGCCAVILGENTSHLFLWEHCTGALVKMIVCPRQGATLQWADEDQGFLFAAVSAQSCITMITVNLTTGKWKQLRQFYTPDKTKLMGVAVQDRKMVAVHWEGITCWDLKSGLLLTETHNTDQNLKLFLSQQVIINVRPDCKVETVQVKSL